MVVIRSIIQTQITIQANYKNNFKKVFLLKKLEPSICKMSSQPCKKLNMLEILRD